MTPQDLPAPASGSRPEDLRELAKAVRQGQLGLAVQQYLAPSLQATLDTLARLAEAGDPRSLALILQYTAGAKAEHVVMPELRDAKTPEARAEVVLCAIADGRVSIQAGKELLDAIRSTAGLRDMSELMDRLDRLEGKRPRHLRDVLDAADVA